MIGFVNVSFDFPPQWQRGRPASWVTLQPGSWMVTEGQADPGNKKETTQKKKRSLIGLGVSGMSIGQRRRRLWLVEVLPAPLSPPRIASNSKGLKLKILFPRRFLAKAASLVFDTLHR